MSRNRNRGGRQSAGAGVAFTLGDRVQYRQGPTRVIKGVINDVQMVPNGFGGMQRQAHIRWDNGASAWTPLTRAIELVPPTSGTGTAGRLEAHPARY